MKPRVMCCALMADEGPHFEILERAGFAVERVDRSLNLSDEQTLISTLAGCSAVLASSEPYTPRVIEGLPHMRVIARTGVGYDAVNVDACDKHRIAITTTPGVNHHSVAEHTIALLMGVARGFPDLDMRVREGRWQRFEYPRVMGCTLGIVGLGRIGQAVVPRALGLGMKVIAHEPYPNTAFVAEHNVELCALDDLLGRADYVSLHIPLTPETKHLLNQERIAKMKPGSVLINTGRGGLVDEKALNDALTSGHLRGAGLDVFEVEPLPLSSPLLNHRHVLLAGHVAGLDAESRHDALTMAAETIASLKNGGWPAECVQNLKGITDWNWDRTTSDR
ncbi:MAG: phosphoglycerate dehydrogenase [Planctomycetaceae bacterium]|nr:phosphoglycerate dehydrogenase [Planctomycetaceae bacterium]